MDSLIAAAARALAAGDPLEALNRIALRGDPAALALRGIALAQLGELQRARQLLHRAALRFGKRESVARARCVVAEFEIALVSRDLNWRHGALEAACSTLERHGDRGNAAHARVLESRRLLLIGRVGQAEIALSRVDRSHVSPALRATIELMTAGIALRRHQARLAQEALERASAAALKSGIPALRAEVETASVSLSRPAGRLIDTRGERFIRLAELETLLDSTALVIDATRGAVHLGLTTISLSRRPVLFALLRELGVAWPLDAGRAALISRAFRGRNADESHRARLRVEIGRLRRLIQELADIRATERGFMLRPHTDSCVAVLAGPADDHHAALLAVLGDGESWSSSALALALGASQRSVQRALDSLLGAGKVNSFGRGRAKRWLSPPPPGFATSLLLPVMPPND